MKKSLSFLLCLTVALALLASSVKAHLLPDSYLQLDIHNSTIHGTWDVFVYSLAVKSNIQDQPERKWQELALHKLSIKTEDAECILKIDETAQKTEEDKFPQALHIAGECPSTITELTINYFSLLVIDPQLQGFINITANGENYTSVLSQQNPSAKFKISNSKSKQATKPNVWQQFKDYALEGVWHIWLGYDHILFLISLLLTAGFKIQGRFWTSQQGFKITFLQVTKIVTSFTLAHSITLSLVIFQIVSLPSQLVESIIALSIAIAAINNIYPMIHKRLWLLIFCFGLIHGMGFAGALQELGLPDNAKWLALIGFNLGVEAGQIVIVTTLLPVIYCLRHNEIYRKIILPISSGIIIFISMVWFTQRVFDISLLGGVLGG